MTRRPPPAFANRVVIGAVTVLVLLVGVFLAYNANSGLPFLPTYDIAVQVPDAAGLLASDGVMIGGTRVGYIGSITAGKLPDGRAFAVLHLKLQRSLPPLPVDSTDLVRPVSPLGLKYLEITRGHARATLPAGATIPLSHTTKPVEIDDFFAIFDRATRRASQIDLSSFGDGLASRGVDLNRALAEVGPTVDALLPAMSNLLAPSTHWVELFPSLQRAAREMALVAADQAQLVDRLDRTFTPLSRQTAALQAAITGGPPALRTATRQLPAEARFMEDSTTLFHRLRPAFASLAQASTALAPAERAGIASLPRAPVLNRRLTATLGALEHLALDARTLPGLQLLSGTAQLLEPTVAYLEPAQTSCNYLALFFRNLEGALSESDQVGTMLGVAAMSLPQLPNSEAGPSSAPADGPPAKDIPGLSSIQQTLVDDSFLHSDPYPYTAAPGQPAECEAGNERYISGRQMIGSAPVSQTGTERTHRVLP